MQNKHRRYLGMGWMQANILACLGLLALVGISCSASQISDLVNPAAVATVQPILVEPATELPLVTDTPSPSDTPELPTPTFTATTYESMIPEGWNQYTYDRVELWMPADFVKTSSESDLIYAENKNNSGNGFYVSVSLTKETPTVTELDDFIREGLKHFTPDTTYLEKKRFEIGGYEAQRLKLQVIMINIPMGEVIYFIKDGGNIWILSGISHYDEFGKWLPTFDQIAHTFRVNP